VCVCVCLYGCVLVEWVFPPLTAPLLLYLSLCKGRRGQQPPAQVQGSTNGMVRMGRVGGVCDPAAASLGACFRESIVCHSAVLEVTVELRSATRLTLDL